MCSEVSIIKEARALPVAPPGEDRLETRVRLDLVRYSNCWEDVNVLIDALRPRPGKRILSIASAGDNTFALLGAGAEVLAVDLSMAQLASVELKAAAFRTLEYEEVLRFLGVRPVPDRMALYARVEKELSPRARVFWGQRLADVSAGMIHSGRFESFFRLFRTRILPLIHPQRQVNQLLEEKDEEARHAFYDQVWNNRRWRLLFRLFFGRFMMGRFGRDPEFFRYVEDPVSDRILARARHALTHLPTHANPYLEYILTGNFSRVLPLYLQPGQFHAIRNGLDRLKFFHGPVEEAALRTRGADFDGFNLSDIFEYLAPETCRTVYERLLSRARPGARLAYWNLLVPRELPQELAGRVRKLPGLSRKLHERDLSFFYRAFIVDEVERPD